MHTLSGWLQKWCTPLLPAEKTIQKFCTIFATHGILHKIVTDNGPTFHSEQFQTFMVLSIYSLATPYHPSSNGLAERAVQSLQTVKQGLHQMQGPESIQIKLSKFLFKYRITLHMTAGIPPCELLTNCWLRSRLDLLHPDTMVSLRAQRTEHKQQSQGATRSTNTPLREFKIGDTVFAEDFTPPSQKWIEGTITAIAYTSPIIRDQTDWWNRSSQTCW